MGETNAPVDLRIHNFNRLRPVAASSVIFYLVRESLAFALGTILGCNLDRLGIRMWMIAATELAADASFGAVALPTLLITCIAVVVFRFTLMQASFLAPLRRMPEDGCSLDIYPFWVQQCMARLSELSTMTKALVSLVVTVPLATSSWHHVEQQAPPLQSRIVAKRPNA